LAGPADDRALIGQLDRGVIALRQKIDHLQAQLETCGTDNIPPPVFVELRTVLAGQPATVARVGRTVTVTVAHGVLFGADGVAIREEAEPLLDLLATAVKLHPELRVTVEAHAESTTVPAALRKLAPTVWELTALRASFVVRALIEKFSVPAAVLTAAGRGVQAPISHDETPDGQALNRRIVFILQPGAAP